MRHEENNARTGLSKSAILSEDERLSEILKPCTDRLLKLYRKSPVKGADETSWSCDGQRDCLELLEKEPANNSLRCSQAQMPDYTFLSWCS